MSFNTLSVDPLSGLKMGNSSTFTSFAFESNYIEDMLRFIQQYWHLSYYIGLAYVAVIFGLQRWMKNQPAYDLKPALFLWNSGLAIFSVAAFLRSVPPYTNIISQENGFYKSICFKTGLNPQSAFWELMFAFLKLVELGDTIFIVLRKRPLVLIHWCHHLMTLLVTWTNAPFMEPITIWYVVLNTGVHSLLYIYYAAKTICIPVPSFVTKMLTTIQFFQIVVGFSVNIASIYLKGVMGYNCARETTTIIATCITGTTFVFLFGKLLYASFSKMEGNKKRD